jgi:hypothetical protein
MLTRRYGVSDTPTGDETMRTKMIDGKLTFEPLLRELDLLERFRDFATECKEYRSLAELADEAHRAATALNNAIAGVAADKPAK